MLTILSHDWTNLSGKQLINLNKHQQDKNTSFRSLTAPIISDHDAPYITDNLRTSKYEVRHKFIRKFKNLNLESYINDCKTLMYSRMLFWRYWRQTGHSKQTYFHSNRQTKNKIYQTTGYLYEGNRNQPPVT